MKKFYGYLILLLFLFPFTNSLIAQNEYEQWKKKEQEKFRIWADEDDKKFHDFLLKEWEKRKVLEGLKDDTKPKPKKPPVYAPVKTEPEVKPPAPEIKQPEPEPEETPTAVTPPPAPKPEPPKTAPPVAAKGSSVSFNFYGSEVSEELPAGFTLPELKGGVSNKSIADYWASLSAQPAAGMITSVKRVKESRKYNDWAFAQYIHSIANKLYGGKKNEAVLFTWFMLIKSGYDCRVAYYGDKIFLMAPSDNKLFGRAYFTLGNPGTKYYTFGLDDIPASMDIEVTTYDESHPDAAKKMNYAVNTPPNMGDGFNTRNINFTYKGKPFTIAIASNSSLVNFYRNYPQVNYQVYLGAPLTEGAETPLIRGLKKLTEGMDDIEKAEFLLKFVQDATGYKTDQDQFGWEKPMFAEESLHYGYSDCEDRSIFYSYLIRKLTKLQVILLDYPGHISTAIKYEGIRAGDYVVYNGSNWLVCDPTYLGAGIGMNMPDFRKVNPQIIEMPK